MTFPKSLPRLLRRLGVAALLSWLFAVAAMARFRLPQTPLSDPDIWCYLNPPLSKLLGGPFQHTYGQCFLYPGWLYVLLKLGGDFRGITVAQHTLGLGTGALFFTAWRQVRGFLPRPRVPGWLFDAAGGGLTALYLLSPETWLFEHSLRPEAVFPFAVMLNICLNLAFIRRRFGPPGDGAGGWRTLVTGGGAVFTCVAAWLLKPSFSIMLLLANLPVIISLFRPGAAPKEKLALVLVPTLTAGLLLVLPEWQLRRSDPNAHQFLAFSLGTVHADLIRDQIADDLARGHTAPYDPAWLAPVHAQLAQEIRASTVTGKYPSLGFDPDYLKTRQSFVGWLARHEGHDRERAADFCDDYYRRAWRGRPLAMVRKVGRQLGGFYRFGACFAYRFYGHPDLQPLYVESVESFDPGPPPFDRDHPRPRSYYDVMQHYPPGAAYLTRCGLLGQRPLALEYVPWLKRPLADFELTSLPCCLAVVAGAAGALVSVAVRRWGGAALALGLFLYSYNFGTTLALSVGHSMDIGRYSLYQFVYTLLPQAVSGWLAVEAALALGVPLVAGAGRRLVAGAGRRLAAGGRKLAPRLPSRFRRAVYILLGLAVGLGMWSVGRHAHRRYRIHRGRLVIAGVLAASAVATAGVGSASSARQRRREGASDLPVTPPESGEPPEPHPR